MADVHNSDDTIDSRDVITAIEDFENEAVGVFMDAHGIDAELPEDFVTGDYLDADDADLYQALKDLADEAGGASDWRSGETLIRDSYFEDYAREFAEEIGAVNPDGGWPSSYIDWKAAAEALQQDYTSVDFDGVTYWLRW